MYCWAGISIAYWRLRTLKAASSTPSLSATGAWPRIDRHIAGQLCMECVYKLFRIWSKSEWNNLRHTETAREETRCGGHSGTIYSSTRHMLTYIYYATNCVEGTQAMENWHRRHNRECLHRKFQNSMGMPTTAVRIFCSFNRSPWRQQRCW